jgi:NADH:ubiquinone oxidoreductase subunit D
VKAALDVIGPRLDEYEAMTLDNRIFLERTSGVGKLDAELALELGITGPILRACGVDHDLRRDAPFHAYDELKVNVATAQGGDCLARAKVRSSRCGRASGWCERWSTRFQREASTPAGR